MANKDANIDLLFRNGLKDLEVLPPVEAWGSIFPVVRKKQRPVIFLRNAALVAVLLSMGFLAYKWSKDMTSMNRNPVLALGEESVKIQSTPGVNTAPAARKQVNLQSAPASSSILSEAALTDSAVKENFVTDPGTPFISDFRSLIADRFLLTPDDILPLPSSQFSGKPETDYGSLDKYSYVEPRVRTDRWSIMAMASPTYYLSPVTGSDDISKQISNSEQSQISYSGGVGFAYKISNKFSIQSGLYYSSVGQEVSGINAFGGFRPYDYTKGDHNFEVMTSNGLISTNNSDLFLIDRSGDRVVTRYTNDVFDPDKAQLSYLSNSLYQNFSYLEMPVIVRYKFIDRIVDLNLIGGLSYNMLINNSVTAVTDGNRYSVGTTELNPFMVSSSLGMGMEYNLSEKLSLNLEPTFRYYLNPFGAMPGIRVHPYSFGVFSGLSFKF